MKAVALASGTRGASVREKMATADERRQAAITEDAARQKKLYGDHVDDVRVLRSRGFEVTAEGRGRYRVGNQVVDGETLKAKADRERRLMGGAGEVRRPTETASGLKVGQAVALTPKPAKGTVRGRASGAARPAALSPAGAGAQRRLGGAAAAARAKASEHSTDLGPRPRVVWLDLGLLDVDRRYQREISQAGNAHINRILRGFNWNRYQPIVVTEGADGRYAVIDGQHRLEAAKKHPLIDSLPCYVIEAPDVAAQAEIFVSVNSDRRALTGLQKFWASVAAGNREAAALAQTCTDAGVTIPRTTPSGGLAARTLIGPNVALRLVGRLGRDAVLAAVRLLAEAWPEARTGFRTANLYAVATIASTAYSRDRLLRALKGFDPDRLYAEALALAGGSSTKELAVASEKLIRTAMVPADERRSRQE